jgi:hypothetical protein
VQFVEIGNNMLQDELNRTKPISNGVLKIIGHDCSEFLQLDGAHLQLM